MKQYFKSKYDGSNNKIGGIEYDFDGWANAKKYKPIPFELTYLKTLKNTIIGWWAGNEWFSHRLKKDDEVIFWKKKPTRSTDI